MPQVFYLFDGFKRPGEGQTYRSCLFRLRLINNFFKMVQITGKYSFVSQDKFEDYLKAAGNVRFISFFKLNCSRPLFLYFRLFNPIECKSSTLFAGGWIRTTDLWNWRQPLYQQLLKCCNHIETFNFLFNWQTPTCMVSYPHQVLKMGHQTKSVWA